MDNNLVETMLALKENWSEISNMIDKIFGIKERKEVEESGEETLVE